MSSQKDLYPFTENGLLSRLPRPDYDRLRTRLEPVRLLRGPVLFEVGETVRHAYFLTGGMVSLLAATADDATVQVAMVGNEGLVGVPAQLGRGVMPYRVVVQLPAPALRVNVTPSARSSAAAGSCMTRCCAICTRSSPRSRSRRSATATTRLGSGSAAGF